MRGPAPMPANVHLLRGNPSKLPMSALLDGKLQPPVEIPRCPAHLQAEARREWKRVCVALAELGLVANIDRAMLASYCAAWSEVVHCEEKIRALCEADPVGEAGLVEQTPSGYRTMSVWVQLRNRAYERLYKFAGDFGMSPSARRSVQASENRQGELPGIERPSVPTAAGFGDFA